MTRPDPDRKSFLREERALEMAEYATESAGTEFDVDPVLEQAATEVLLSDSE